VVRRKTKNFGFGEHGCCLGFGYSIVYERKAEASVCDRGLGDRFVFSVFVKKREKRKLYSN
jgi:hypothetical protein